MCVSLGGGPSYPPVEPVQVAPQTSADPSDKETAKRLASVSADTRKRAALASGRSGNVLTSGLGVTAPARTVKNVYGL